MVLWSEMRQLVIAYCARMMRALDSSRPRSKRLTLTIPTHPTAATPADKSDASLAMETIACTASNLLQSVPPSSD